MMEPDNRPETAPLFPTDYRGSGLLLHVASLPSPYGIGDIGPVAFEWIDRLQSSGQHWWQSLRLGPDGIANPQYQSSSSFAGHEMLISPDILIEEELLRTSDCQGYSFPSDSIDYDAVIPFKHRLLHLAWANFKAGSRREMKAAFEQFRHSEAGWLNDYALFQALKTQFGGIHYLEWPSAIIFREPEAMRKAGSELADQVEQVSFAQFLLFRRMRAIKEYAHAHGIRLIGELPFFVSPDSSDVWSNPEYFLLDENRRPRFVAGVPPDYYSSLGQRWGNPVYNWSALRDTGFRWCIDRFRAALACVDVIRLDHFRGFAAAWHVPVGAPTARCGQWVLGPGAQLFTAVLTELGSLPFIAEDLGMITADVWHLLDQIEAPGTRVLQFAFDGHSDNPHLPSNYVANTVVYTGSLDNPTARSWYEKLAPNERRNFWRYLRRPGGEATDVASSLITLAWSSRAALAIAPLQDLLNISSETQGAIAGIRGGNMHWRATGDMLNAHAFEWLRQLSKATKRVGVDRELQLKEIA